MYNIVCNTNTTTNANEIKALTRVESGKYIYALAEYSSISHSPSWYSRSRHHHRFGTRHANTNTIQLTFNNIERDCVTRDFFKVQLRIINREFRTIANWRSKIPPSQYT